MILLNANGVLFMPRYDNRPYTAIPLATLICGLGLIVSRRLSPGFLLEVFSITVFATTTIVLYGIDRQISRYDYRPFFEISLKATFITALIVGLWVFFGGLWTHYPLFLVATAFGVYYSFIFAIPACVVYVMIRNHFYPVISDTFVRCRQCEYRVDNLAGPRCPECGTPIAGIIESDND